MEPNSMLVIQKRNSNEYIYLFFVSPKDEVKELWSGPITGIEIAKKYFNFENVTFGIIEFKDIFHQ
jgi:hypothetical protein